MSQPLVSIVIPCFNAERFVGDAIRSALEQTYPRKEVIAIDDGSTDKSLEVIRSFGDAIRWETGPNRGACAARNRGLDMAEGEFVQFLDADDLLDACKVERCLQVLRERPDALVYTWHRVVSLDPDKVPAKQWNRRRGTEDPVRFMLQGDLPTPAPLHRRSTIDALGGFRECLPCAQDREFHLRMALGGVEFHMLAEELFTIRRRAGSIGTKNFQRLHAQRALLARDVYARLVDEGRITDALAAECAAMLTKAARGLALSAPQDSRLMFEEAKRMHRSGGLHLAYSGKLRSLVKLIGPIAAERIVSSMRRRPSTV